MNLAKFTSWVAAAGQKPDIQEGYNGEESDRAGDKLYVL